MNFEELTSLAAKPDTPLKLLVDGSEVEVTGAHLELGNPDPAEGEDDGGVQAVVLEAGN